ncbi:MAG: prepilin peptidase [Rhodobacterales bacterium]
MLHLPLPEYILLIPAIPICIWVAYSDMKFMRIPNVACYALFIGFLLIGPLILDLHEYGIRIAQAFVVLFIGFFVTSMGFAGGGDSKFAAAMAPYIALGKIIPFIFIIGIMSLFLIGLHKLIGVTPGLKNLIKDWDSWNAYGMFPYGVTLTASLITYLLINTWYS